LGALGALALIILLAVFPLRFTGAGCDFVEAVVFMLRLFVFIVLCSFEHISIAATLHFNLVARIRRMHFAPSCSQ
jgi:hypothetical protein